jgi:hypothetical protein
MTVRYFAPTRQRAWLNLQQARETWAYFKRPE